MRVAAILSFSSEQSIGEVTLEDARQPLARASYVSLEILGKTLKDRLVSKLSQFGVETCTIIASDSADTLLPRSGARSDIFVEAWEKAIGNYVHQGIESVLLVRSSAYCDLDYDEMFRFHVESGSPLTQAYTPDGALDITLIDATVLRRADCSYRHALTTLIPKQRRYVYRGYVNPLAQPADFYQLVNDGLHGRCELRPMGSETRERVWQGSGAEIDESAAVKGPAFIGTGCHVAACCTIGEGTAIERDCEVDCGTVVEESWIAQNTYLGVALDFRRSIVNGKRLFRVDRNVAMNIDDDRLIAPTLKTLPFLASLGDRFRRPERAT